MINGLKFHDAIEKLGADEIFKFEQDIIRQMARTAVPGMVQDGAMGLSEAVHPEGHIKALKLAQPAYLGDNVHPERSGKGAHDTVRSQSGNGSGCLTSMNLITMPFFVCSPRMPNQ